MPLNLDIAQLVKIGKLPVQFQIGGKYYAVRPDPHPIGHSLRRHAAISKKINSLGSTGNTSHNQNKPNENTNANVSPTHFKPHNGSTCAECPD